MNKLLEYGRKAMFFVRVLSGYEERRIRAYRLQLQEQIEKAQAKKAEARKLPEQAILSEVRRMVEEMQALNRNLEETDKILQRADILLRVRSCLQVINTPNSKGACEWLKETAIEEYFKPIDKNAHVIMNMQLEKEENQMKEMVKAMQEQALHHKEMALRQAELNSVDPGSQIQNPESPRKQDHAT